MTVDHAEFYKKQISLTEWLQNMGHADAEAMRQEDNDKRERLRRLHEVISLPFDQPHQFEATAVVEAGPAFRKFLEEHGSELCAIRLMPHDPALPKLRMRGKSIREAIDWLAEQAIDPAGYRIDFVPHIENTRFATIFVVNAHGVFGEITRGAHNELTQGHYEAHQPVAFSYDYKTWKFEREDAEAAAQLAEIIAMLQVEDAAKRHTIEQELDAGFSNGYLEGYFETTTNDEFGTWFIDYNRILGRLYADSQGTVATSSSRPANAGHRATEALVRGQTGSTGQASGTVHIVDNPTDATFQPGEILVCRMTSPDYLPLMQRAAAIVTDMGGILSHAAIVARELSKPCLTATRNATQILKTGQTVLVDADAGTVTVFTEGV